MKKLPIITILLFLTLILAGCFGKPQPPVNQNVNINTTPTTTENLNNDGLKIYKDELFNFQFKYPENYEIDNEHSNTIKFLDKNNKEEGFVLSVYPTGYKNEEEFVRLITAERNNNFFDYYFSNDKVEGKTYKMVHWLWNYKDTLGYNNYSEFLLYNEVFDYGLSVLVYVPDPDIIEMNNLLYEIKESFVFLEDNMSDLKVDTSNWKTYKSESLDFKFKYPENWKITKNEYYVLIINIPVCDNVSNLCINADIRFSDRGQGVSIYQKDYLNEGDIPDNFQYKIKESKDLIVLSDMTIAEKKLKNHFSFYVKTPISVYSANWYRNSFIFFSENKNSKKYDVIFERMRNEFTMFKVFLDSIEYNSGGSSLDTNIDNWLTYENKDYGFKFEYPSGWVLDSDGVKINEDSYFIVSVSAKTIKNLGVWVYEKSNKSDGGNCWYRFQGILSCETGNKYARNWSITFPLKEKRLNIIINYNYDYATPSNQLSHDEKKIEYIINQIKNSFEFIN